MGKQGVIGVAIAALCGLLGCAPDEADRSALLHADPTLCPPSDAGSKVSVLVCRQAWIGGLAVDAQYLYFLAGDTLDAPYANTVKRMPLVGGSVETIATFDAKHDLPLDASAENGSWLAVNGTDLVWAVPSTGRILAMPKRGGDVRTLASGQDVPLRVAIDETHAYWTNWSSCVQCARGSVHSVALSGDEEPKTIATRQDHPNGITLDRVNVYWVTAGGTVMQAPLVGGLPITLASGLTNPFFVTVDAATVYWTQPKGLMSCPILGCNRRPTQVVSGLKAPNVVVADSSTLYFSDWDAGAILKLLKTRDEPTVIARGLVHPDVVVLGGSTVYWYTAGPEGSIMSAPK